MNEKPKAQQILYSVLAIILWLVTFGLGLECIYVLKELFYLAFSSMGGYLVKAERYSLALIFVLGLALLIFIIGTGEYHRKRWGTRESWRLFAWSIAVELSIIAVYYIL